MYQTAADTGVSILCQKSNVAQQYRCLISINQNSAYRASIQKNDSIICSRKGPFTNKKLHPDKGTLLVVIPTRYFQFLDTRARVNFQQERLVVGCHLVEREINLFVLH